MCDMKHIAFLLALFTLASTAAFAQKPLKDKTPFSVVEASIPDMQADRKSVV